MAMKELILEKLQHRYLTEISRYLLYILKEKKIKEEGKEQEERKRERSKEGTLLLYWQPLISNNLGNILLILAIFCPLSVYRGVIFCSLGWKYIIANMKYMDLDGAYCYKDSTNRPKNN